MVNTLCGGWYLHEATVVLSPKGPFVVLLSHHVQHALQVHRVADIRHLVVAVPQGMNATVHKKVEWSFRCDRDSSGYKYVMPAQWAHVDIPLCSKGVCPFCSTFRVQVGANMHCSQR